MALINRINDICLRRQYYILKGNTFHFMMKLRCINIILYFIIYLLSSISVNSESCGYKLEVEDIDNYKYVDKKVLNIGAFVQMTKSPSADSDVLCTNKVNDAGLWPLEYVEAIKFGVQRINQNTSILPNIELGFVGLNDCGSVNTNSVQSLKFVPQQKIGSNPNQKYTCLEDNDDSYFDVVGVLGPFTSALTLAITPLYTAIKLPMLSYMATSDELNDRSTNRYFLRVVPPDSYQIEAMLTFIQRHGWTYISIVYESGSYGQKAYDAIRSKVALYNICIASAQPVDEFQNKYQEVVSRLLTNRNARVVIVFTNHIEAKYLFESIRDRGELKYFIWICSDGIADKLSSFKGIPEVLVGAITFIFNSRPVQALHEHLGNLTLAENQNPWMQLFWEQEFDCKVSDNNCPQDALNYNGKRHFVSRTSLALDCVKAFALALDNIINTYCPDATVGDVRECINGERLIDALSKLEFDGDTGPIKFNNNGNVIGKYQIRQIVCELENSEFTTKLYDGKCDQMGERLIGFFENGKIELKNKLSWDHLLTNNSGKMENHKDGSEKVIPHPKSTCSSPCELGKMRSYKGNKCCWECRDCRDNERLINDGTACMECPAFSWPDPNSLYTTCVRINGTYPTFTESIPFFQFCIATIGIVSTFVIFLAFVAFRNEPVIRKTHIEYSFTKMFAIVCGYGAVIVSRVMPTQPTCTTLFVLLYISFSALYSAMLVKSIRTYMLYLTEIHKWKSGKYVDRTVQLVVCCILTAIQLMVYLLLASYQEPSISNHQPERQKKEVNMACTASDLSWVAFLGVSIVILGLIFYLSFKARIVPDKYDQAHYLYQCAFIHIITWISFAGAIFTTYKAAQDRTRLLAYAVLCTHSFAVLLFFVTKMYILRSQ